MDPAFIRYGQAGRPCHTFAVAASAYLICAVQRSGSWLLCHALQDTGVLGVPAEYFHRGDEQFWRDRWGAATEEAFLQALREQPVTANGVWGSKMMWNYFDDALARLRAWPRLGLPSDAVDPDVLAAAFPGVRYVWLRRDDKLRQAISLWRAAATGQYALADGQQPAPPPPFDRDAIGRLVQWVEEGEAGWRRWFAAHSISPLEIVYEDMTRRLTTVVRDVAAFLGVPLPQGLGPLHPRMLRQADHHTERLVERFRGLSS
jgi:trehalose 2-sulfotransferase